MNGMVRTINWVVTIGFLLLSILLFVQYVVILRTSPFLSNRSVYILFACLWFFFALLWLWQLGRLTGSKIKL